VVLSKCRRHEGPQQTKLPVTHLPETVTAREMVGVYLRRWWIEIVQPPMTPRGGLSLGAGGHHRATRHLSGGDAAAIDPPGSQGAALGRRALGQGRRPLPATRLEALGPGGDGHLLLRLRFQLAPLLRQAVWGLGHLLACARDLVAPDALGQSPLPHAGLRPPCAAVGPLAFMGATVASSRPQGRGPAPPASVGRARWARASHARPLTLATPAHAPA
jgi:hypothetical protein